MGAIKRKYPPSSGAKSTKKPKTADVKTKKPVKAQLDHFPEPESSDDEDQDMGGVRTPASPLSDRLLKVIPASSSLTDPLLRHMRNSVRSPKSARPPNPTRTSLDGRRRSGRGCVASLTFPRRSARNSSMSCSPSSTAAYGTLSSSTTACALSSVRSNTPTWSRGRTS
jgi:hypothetical protein